jgi:two-component system, chemotaxis family, protein-glutamate methylesterase/glutaminase
MLPDQPRVFIIDDNVGLRASLRELFTDAGVTVVGEAGDAMEALRKVPPLAYTAPVVTLMDVRMPGPINGIEATRLLLDRCAEVRVIVFTAFLSGGIEAAARTAGAVELLAKGAPAAELVAAVERAWSVTVAR